MNFLIISPSWVGDMVISNSLHQTLKGLHPNCNIDVLASEWCVGLLDKMPEIGGKMALPIRHGELKLRERRAIGDKLSDHYDEAIVLPNSFKSALIPYFAKIPKRTGWIGEMRFRLLTNPHFHPQNFSSLVARYNALAYPRETVLEDHAEAYPKPHLIVTATSLKQTLRRLKKILPETFAQDSLVALCPGAEYGPAKRWPHYHFAALAERLIHDGHRVVIFGSEAEQKLAGSIIALSKKPDAITNLAGKTTLTEAVDLMSIMRLVVSNDSGLMHVAAALKLPLIALFGPTSPDFTPPLSDRAIIVRKIRGYHKMRKSRDSREGYHKSLMKIEPLEIYRIARGLIS